MVGKRHLEPLLTSDFSLMNSAGNDLDGVYMCYAAAAPEMNTNLSMQHNSVLERDDSLLASRRVHHMATY